MFSVVNNPTSLSVKLPILSGKSFTMTFISDWIELKGEKHVAVQFFSGNTWMESVYITVFTKY